MAQDWPYTMQRTRCSKGTHFGVASSGYKEKEQVKNILEKDNRMGIAAGRLKLERSERTSLRQNQIGELYEGRRTHNGRKGENNDDYDDDIDDGDYYYCDDDDDESGGAYGTYWGETRCLQGFAGELEGKGLLGRPRHKWGDNIKMWLEEVCWEDFDQIDLAYDRVKWRAVVNKVMNLRVPQKAENYRVLKQDCAPCG